MSFSIASVSTSPDERASVQQDAKLVYELLNDPKGDRQQFTRQWLDAHLASVQNESSELPNDPLALYAWMDANVEAVGKRYADYLARRKAGGPRELLANRSHALHFLCGIAPTKLVDGAWLYSSLSRWTDSRMAPLVSTYLEELGDGDVTQNHVVMFKNLLKQVGASENALSLSDEHYMQGAIQLALAAHGRSLVPEMIGFNLGYEQLPLHLHISAYELNELGIDPYYFTVHITVDNAGSGHARQAVQAVLNALPEDPDARARFYQRVRMGFALNDVGLGATDIANRFDLDAAMVDMLKAKSRYGRAAHADYCKVAGRTINAWLSDEDQIPELLQALQDAKWIARHQDPEQSRFWKLLQGEHAEMFGVFSPLELQLVYDWIAGDCETYLPGPALPSSPARPLVRGKHLTYRAQRKLASAQSLRLGASTISSIVLDEIDSDYDRQPADLQTRLAKAVNAEQRMQLLIEQMSPQRHHSPEGLIATQLFRKEIMTIPSA